MNERYFAVCTYKRVRGYAHAEQISLELLYSACWRHKSEVFLCGWRCAYTIAIGQPDALMHAKFDVVLE